RSFLAAFYCFRQLRRAPVAAQPSPSRFRSLRSLTDSLEVCPGRASQRPKGDRPVRPRSLRPRCRPRRAEADPVATREEFSRMRACILFVIVAALAGAVVSAPAQEGGARFTVHSARSGRWSDPATWAERRVPGAGDVVQIRGPHTVVYDANSDRALRMLH